MAEQFIACFVLVVSGSWLVFFLLCGFFPLGFSHGGLFHAGVWAHPAKLVFWLPLYVCVCVCVCVCMI